MTPSVTRAAAERRLLQLHAATCSILAHPTRLAMIEALRDGERTVSDLVRTVGTSAGNLSQHLGAMRQCGVVESRRDGRYAFYRISDARILTAFRLMREVLLSRLTRDARLADRVAAPVGRPAGRRATAHSPTATTRTHR